MTSLNKHLPLEVVKQNEALQEIECNKYRRLCNGSYEGEDKYELEVYPIVANYIKNFYLQALTIADVIDNAEELFGDKLLNNYSLKNYQHHSHQLIEMCQQDKSIEDISSYIISNLLKE